jgi:large subunit ribosomal protein L25
MGDVQLSIEARNEVGKNAVRKIRMNGRAPGVVYGPKREPLSVSFDPRILDQLLRRSEAGANTLIDLTGEQSLSGSTVIARELQRDPLAGSIVHADFYELDMKAAVEVAVPLHFVGEAKGVEIEGGVLDHPHREIQVECLPDLIPDSIELDISDLAIGDSLHVSDLTVPEGVTILDDPELTVASVLAPRLVRAEGEEEAEAEEVAEAGEAAEASDAAPATEGSD